MLGRAPVSVSLADECMSEEIRVEVEINLIPNIGQSSVASLVAGFPLCVPVGGRSFEFLS